ncbi:MAG TPA: glycosyltransferase, partial [Acidimicrobiales bacterium]|nr:glycosyltransferase [Acidimicrobiales bacterium]
MTDPVRGAPVVVALIPAKDAADAIADTVVAAAGIAGVRRVLVVDDGSTDATAAVARAAGAEVLVLPANRGKGGAVAAGVDACPDADIVLLLDADLRGTAAEGARLLPPVLADEADLAIAVLPSAAGRGGFGTVRDLAAWGIRRASGVEARAPLSGQRAVRIELLRDLSSAERFGLEVAMTIDAARAGARIVEVDAPIEHRHTGRSVAGFRHRARQGGDVVRALWPRLTSRALRSTLVVVVALATLAGLFLGAAAATPDTVASAGPAERVVVVGIPHLGLDDLDRGRVPAIDALWQGDGALAAASVRTLSSRPSTVEAWATLGAGARVRAGAGASQAFPADAPFEGDTAGRVTARRTGSGITGDVAVVEAAAVVAQAGRDVPSEPGALGDALADAGLLAGVVGNADTVRADGDRSVARPAAVAVMRTDGFVDVGTVDASLLVEDPTAPCG